MGRFRTFKVVKFVVFGVLFMAAVSFVTMLLWNALMPGIFGLPALDLGQTFGLLVLSRLLTGGFRPGWRGGHSRHHHWKQKMSERWAKMTPEEREHWKSHWSGRCGKFRETAPPANDAQSDFV